jgi:hypothetical protein
MGTLVSDYGWSACTPQGSTEGFLPDNGYVANVLAAVTGDPSQLGYEGMRGLMFE